MLDTKLPIRSSDEFAKGQDILNDLYVLLPSHNICRDTFSPLISWYNLLHFGTNWFNLVQFGTFLYNLVQYGTTWYNLV